MELPKSIKDRIEKEARLNADYDLLTIGNYIAGATSEALRSAKLVEALEEIADKSDKNSTACLIAKKAIQEYQK